MLRAARCGWVVILLVAAGCTKEEDYLEVSREQRAAWKEMTDILATIKDEKSMADAQVALKKHTPKYEALARKAKALPKPPPDVIKRLQEDEVIIRATLRHLHTEVERVGKLPGGDEFMKQFQSNSQGLMPAVQP